LWYIDHVLIIDLTKGEKLEINSLYNTLNILELARGARPRRLFTARNHDASSCCYSRCNTGANGQRCKTRSAC